MKANKKLPVLSPDLQIDFFYRLKLLRKHYFHQALHDTIETLDIKEIDAQLTKFVNAKSLNKLASYGIRGEVFFPIPYIIQANPKLLGYYRLLYGCSQKEFYNKGPFGRFKHFEERGRILKKILPEVTNLCRSLIGTAQILIDSLDEISLSTVHDLQLLTLGPQLRGGQNTRVGKSATAEVFNLIKDLIKPYIIESNNKVIKIRNDSKRNVTLEFSSDPDIRITEDMESGIRPLVSVEIKGGLDASNIHNRLGEAEKSHQKAKTAGFFEFWTIIRVFMDYKVAKQESPTTSHFFHIDRITDYSDSEHDQFKDLLSSLLSIRIRTR